MRKLATTDIFIIVEVHFARIAIVEIVGIFGHIRFEAEQPAIGFRKIPPALDGAVFGDHYFTINPQRSQ